MPATGQDLTCWAGDTVEIDIQVLAHGGAPFDLSGATAVRWALSRHATDTTAALSKSLTDGITITDAVAGRFAIAIDPADTATLAGDYYHQATITDAAGDVLTVAVGTATIMSSLLR